MDPAKMGDAISEAVGVFGRIFPPNSDSVAKDLEYMCNTSGADCGGAPDAFVANCQKNGHSRCEEIVREGVEKYCKKEYREAVCGATTTAMPLSSPSSSPLPLLLFIIGGVIGAVVLAAIAIGLFIYCRKKKKAGKKQSMTGTTVTGTTTAGSGTTTAGGGPATATATNVPARY